MDNRVFVCACSPGYSCFACGEVERRRKALDKLPPPCPDCPRLYAEIDKLRRVAALALLLARHGDYNNGVTSPEGWDEGLSRSNQALFNIEAEATVLGVWLEGQTFHEIDKHYEEA